MRIALDFDNTYTLDPLFWDDFIDSLKSSGYTVSFVTLRGDPSLLGSPCNSDIKGAAEKLGIEIIFTNGQQKAGLFKADIWIDCLPVNIPVSTDLINMHKGCLINKDSNPAL